MKILLSILAATIAPAICLGQTNAAGHKGHHDAGYRMTPMPAPPLRTGLGTTTLRMSTQSKQAQQYFVQGVESAALLLGFRSVPGV